MSHENKGSMTTSIVVAQDGTGNFDCTGVNDQVEIALAITRAVNTGVERIKFKPGTYDINNLTISAAVEIVGEEGVIWDFPATPSLTTSAKVIFRNMEFFSDFDGQGHIVLGGDTIFTDIHFNFLLDTEAETNIAVMASNAAGNRIEMFNCQLTGGEAGAQYFGLLRFADDADELIVRNFLVNTVIVNDVTVGLGQIFKINTGNTVTYAEFRNVEILTVNVKTHVHLLFIPDGAACTDIEMTGVFIRGGTWTDAASRCNIISSTEASTSVTLEDIEMRGQFHPIVDAVTLTVSNLRAFSNGNDGVANIDLNASNTANLDAKFDNCHFDDASLDMNRGWRRLIVSNCQFEGGRINILDELSDLDPGLEKTVTVDGCQWKMTAGGLYHAAIVCQYGQGVNLEYLQVSNTKFETESGGPSVFNAAGAVTTTHLIFDHIIVEPRIGDSNPKFIIGNARTAHDQIVWIFNSEIWCEDPPLENWNVATYSNYDKFDSVTWWDNATSARLYSENCGVATIDNGTAVEVVNHELACVAATRFATPDCIMLTGAENHVEASQVIRDTLTATQFSIRFVGGGNVTADRDVQWRARMTR